MCDSSNRAANEAISAGFVHAQRLQRAALGLGELRLAGAGLGWSGRSWRWQRQQQALQLRAGAGDAQQVVKGSIVFMGSLSVRCVKNPPAPAIVFIRG